MHYLPPCDQTINKKGKNVTTKIVVVEFWKQLSPNKSSEKIITMHVRVDIINALFIKLVIGLNNGQCSS